MIKRSKPPPPVPKPPSWLAEGLGKPKAGDPDWERTDIDPAHWEREASRGVLRVEVHPSPVDVDLLEGMGGPYGTRQAYEVRIVPRFGRAITVAKDSINDLIDCLERARDFVEENAERLPERIGGGHERSV